MSPDPVKPNPIDVFQRFVSLVLFAVPDTALSLGKCAAFAMNAVDTKALKGNTLRFSVNRLSGSFYTGMKLVLLAVKNGLAD